LRQEEEEVEGGGEGRGEGEGGMIIINKEEWID
jgi:hypothetical protein